ncbi:MAG: PA14 domain-containing protein [Sedimentisphaerales bacterium]|nr:PA14 domain-containing protein [Sedimentisphaerales bacterium]
MRRLFVMSLLMALVIAMAAQAVTMYRWQNTNVGSGAAALDVVRSGKAPDATVPLAKIEWTDASTGYTANYYVGYVTGWIVPPADGEYTFYVASDDDSIFALSPDADIAKAVAICSVTGWTSANQWGKFASQKSAPVTLQAGQRYAFYLVMREGTGGDNASVGWTGPDPIGPTITVVDGQYVLEDVAPDKVTFTSVTNAAAIVGNSATLRATAVSMKPWTFTYEWYKQSGEKVGDGTSLTIAAVTEADEGLYYCRSGDSVSPDALLDVTHGLVHRYTFNDEDVDLMTFIQDVVGGEEWDGMLINQTGNAVFQDGKLLFGNSGQTSNSGTGDYVDLPNGIMTSSLMTQFTIETWVTPMGAQLWQRIFDFGTSDQGENKSPSANNTAYIFLSTRTWGNTAARFAYKKPITPESGAIEKQVDPRPSSNYILPLNQEANLTVVWDEVSGLAKLYYNGVIMGRNTLHMKLSQLTDNNNWIGRSQWNDPLLVGAINEFRIWDTALSAAEIARHYLVGPDDTSLSEPGACVTGVRSMGDLNGDCVMDFIDYAMMIEQWMMDTTPLQ